MNGKIDIKNYFPILEEAIHLLDNYNINVVVEIIFNKRKEAYLIYRCVKYKRKKNGKQKLFEELFEEEDIEEYAGAGQKKNAIIGIKVL